MSDTTSLEAAVADLIPRARNGDAGALEDVLKASRGVVYRWALVVTGDEADAEDVTQEVLITLHASLPGFEGRSRFSTWLYQVTRNEALNLRRRLTRRLRLVADVAREAEVATGGDEALARAHATGVTALVEALLHLLPRREREVFHLADLEGCALTEIATRLGISPSTVRVHLFHARRSMRQQILERWPGLAEERA